MKFLKTKAKPEAATLTTPNIDVTGIVKGVIDAIRSSGDSAVREYSEKFDKWSPESFKLSAEDITSIIAEVDPQIIKDIKQVQSNVRTFAEAQKAALKDFELEVQPGVFLGQKNIPIQNVGA